MFELKENIISEITTQVPKNFFPEQMSEFVNSIAEALSKAQGEMSFAKKEGINPFHRSKYALLVDIVEASKEPMQKYGLSLTQMPTLIDGQFVLVSLLLHSSGQWFRSVYPLDPIKKDNQSLGMSISYAKRYAWMALLGMGVSDKLDDDGEQERKSMTEEANKPAKLSPSVPNSAPTLSWEEIQDIENMVKDDPEALTSIKKSKGSIANILAADFRKTMEWLSKRAESRKEKGGKQ